jgi:hypothetical protein
MVTKTDLRARLTLKTGGNPQFGSANRFTPTYYEPLRGPGSALQRTNGILFPYTPNISVAHAVEYSPYETVHSNYQQHAYSKTRNPTLQITANFVSQTPDEAKYTVGMMHFLRVVTKMNFGRDDPDAGTPPPVLNFSAYGDFNFNNVPVLVGSFNFIYEDGVDYVEVDATGSNQPVQIPVMMTVAIDLLPQYSPTRQNNFNLRDFASGNGYRAGFI